MNQPIIHAEPDPRSEQLAATWSNLADQRVGTKALYATDDFFAPKERMLSTEPPVFIPGKFDDNGKWMDGWESRRKRVAGHDYCDIKLGLPGIIKVIDIDTSHFTGNYPPEAIVEACWSSSDDLDNAKWVEIIPKSAIKGDSHNIFDVENEQVFNHVRLHILPDGGLARFKVYGIGRQDWSQFEPGSVVDLSAMANGGRVIAWSDAHFGRPDNIITPGRGANMGDGWETRRRRVPGNDWLILRLAKRGALQRVEIDTAHFKGNFPETFSLSGALIENEDVKDIADKSHDWPVLLEKQKLDADSVFVFDKEVIDIGTITHVRMDIFPDGGVSRLRLFGVPEQGS